MEICDVFSMNGIENNPASGEIFLENVILKVSQTNFSRISIPRGGINFSRGGNAPPLGGAVKYPDCSLLRYILYLLISLDLSTIKLFTHDLEFHLVFVCKRMQDHYKTIKQFRFITRLLS